jgi:hypothetical protein
VEAGDVQPEDEAAVGRGHGFGPAAGAASPLPIVWR